MDGPGRSARYCGSDPHRPGASLGATGTTTFGDFGSPRTDKHARQDLGRYQEDGIGILRALRPQPRPLAGDQESHYDAFMASQPDQRQPDPEQREDEQLPDEPSTDKNRLRSALRKAGKAGAAVGDAAIEFLSNLIP
jgi:hypothetical protein